MTRAAPIWTDTETTDWESGKVLREDKIISQILQNLEYLAQKHDHSGDPGDGATMITQSPLMMVFYGPAWVG